jgi:hypothetical protein
VGECGSRTGGGERRLPVGELLTLAALLVAAFFALGWLHQTVHFPASAQTRINLRFAQQPDYLEALDGYRRWPPAYVTLLWGARRVGLDHLRVNELLLCAGLALVWWTARRVVPGVHPIYPTVAYALANVHLRITAWATAEALFVALSLLLLLALLAYCRERSGTRLAALVAVSASLCLTRYFAVFWVLPVVFLNVLVAPGALRRRVAHAVTFGLAASAPVAAWLAKEYARTGFLTGMDRLGQRRHQDETNLLHNLAYTAKSLLYDLLSPEREATHMAMRLPWPPGFLDVAIPAAVGAALAVAGVVLWRGRARAPFSWQRLRAWLQRAEGLTFQLFASYPVVLVALWTLGNNDPIYGRFLYPSYVFLLLLLFALYARVERNPLAAWPLRASLLLFVAVQVQRTLERLDNPAWFQTPL